MAPRSTPELSVTVETGDLYRALKSVVPHASSIKDDHVLGRVVIDVDPINLTVMATDRYSVALGLVSILETTGRQQVGRIHLSRSQVKEWLALFPADPKADDATLRIDVTPRHVTVTDSSGLPGLDGKSYQLPRMGDQKYPDLQVLVANALARPRDTTSVLHADGVRLARFSAAATAYKLPLQIEPTGDNTALIIACGDSLLGLVMPIKASEDATALAAGWRKDWGTRLPDAEAGQLAIDVPLPTGATAPTGDEDEDPDDDPGAGTQPAFSDPEGNGQ